jgi:hypothetical protein
VNNELERIWKEMVAEVLSWHLSGDTKTANVQADIQTRNLPITSQEHKIFQFYFGNHRKCAMKSKAGYQARSEG